MTPTPMSAPRRTLRTIGSLWFAAILLVLLLVGMACATVVESSRSTEVAQALFYRAEWFTLLLCLLAVNIAAATLARYPFAKKHIGFALTHVSILVILAGALVTARIGVNGQIGIAEGETTREFTVPVDVLTVINRTDSNEVAVELDSSAFRGFQPVDNPDAPVLMNGDLQVEVLRFLPNSTMATQVVDENPALSPAVEVSLAPAGREQPVWLFPEKPAMLGVVPAKFRFLSDSNELARLVAETTVDRGEADGVVKIDYGGLKFEFPLSRCLEEAVPLKDLGYTVRVLRYLPHANVGPDNKLVNASDNPINPAIEAEFVGPEGTERRIAFARFPDFGSMHKGQQKEGFKIAFTAPQKSAHTVPIEVLLGPEDETYVRFIPDGRRVVTRELSLGEPVDSPWPNQVFTVLRRFKHARMEPVVTPADPEADTRMPAVRLKVSSGEQSSAVWLQKYRPSTMTVNKVPYELAYHRKAIPLDFALTLESFTVGRYPGGNRPRSFESQITIDDPVAGGKSTRVVSMNSPVAHGGYTFYQQAYRQEAGRAISFLNVARDPGQIVVFVGYIGLMIGMIVVLGTRIVEKRRAARNVTSIGAVGLGSPVTGAGVAKLQTVSSKV
ncbi:MAG: cytochrome c biogenesis protein ResB [Phycisphaerales bacterium]|nr:MAG: cytochrome c biogenesis protein ResB [Phycisphaerales bacterium]